MMNGYLRFLKGLSQYQQRAEIGRLAFTERWDGSYLKEDLLQHPAMITYSKSLGVNPALWEFELHHYAEEPDLIGAPVFCEDQSRAQFTSRYEHVSGKSLGDRSTDALRLAIHSAISQSPKTRSRISKARNKGPVRSGPSSSGRAHRVCSRPVHRADLVSSLRGRRVFEV
jgi:hypothetical protein